MVKKFNVAVVGATGAVGEVLIELLEKRNFPIKNLYLLASERSAGNNVSFAGKRLSVQNLAEFDFSQADIGLFSAGGSISEEYAPKAATAGCIVIDNTSHFRRDEDIPLVVPEVNPHAIAQYSVRNIIANPNCSTIQMLVALAPLQNNFGIDRLVISTYQSITGTGVAAVQQLENEYEGKKGEMAYPYPIHRNALPHCDVFQENGYTKEEMKLVKETHKILGDDSIRITATAIRIPVVGGHSESVNVELKAATTVADIRQLLHNSPGVVVQDNPDTNTYPMPIYAEGKDDVFVGRIRQDFSQENAFNLWIVSDNLRKGAATNTVQIAEYLVANELL